MKIRELTQALEQWASQSLQESYDNSGLQAGNPEAEIKGVLVCLDITEAIVEEAIEKQCNLVISHHPLLFTPLRSLTGAGWVERTLLLAVKKDIALYSMHTNLDNVTHGVNRELCQRLGLTDTQVLRPGSGPLKKLYTFVPEEQAAEVRQALFDAGAGHIGRYDHCSYNTKGFGTFRAGEGTNPYVGEKGKEHHEPEIRIEAVFPAWLEKQVVSALLEAHPYEEVAYDIIPLGNRDPRTGAGMVGSLPEPMDETAFLRHVAQALECHGLRHSPLTGRKVQRVAVCGGAGSFLLEDAIRAGAQAFVTADVKYHRFFDTDSKILLADAGHYETEQYTMQLIAGFIREKFSTFALHLTSLNTNPVNYL